MKTTDLRERDQVDHIIKATSQLKLEHETRSERSCVPTITLPS
jgi:hypothetical protein